jgi:hypothetical protein
MSERREAVRDSAVTHIEWSDGIAHLECACGNDDLSIGIDEDGLICPACGRSYGALVEPSLYVWCDGQLLGGVTQ